MKKFIIFLILTIVFFSCIRFPNASLSTYLTKEELSKYVLPYQKEKVGYKVDSFFVQTIEAENIKKIIKENTHTLVLFWYPCPSTRNFVKDVIIVANQTQNKYTNLFKTILVTPEYSLGNQQKILKSLDFKYVTYLLDEKIYGNSILKKQINFISKFELPVSKKEIENVDFILFDRESKPLFIGISKWNNSKKYSEIIDYSKFITLLNTIYP